MRIAKALLPLCSSLLVLSCDNRTSVEKATEAGILVIGNSNEPKGLDLHLVSGVLESNIIRALFEGLAVEHPSEDSTALPGAATSWSANDDFTVWTFKLQPEGKWSDGVPVTAHDFVFSYQRMLHPKIPAKYSDMLYFMKNAEIVNRDLRSLALLKDLDDIGIPHTALKDPPFSKDGEINTKPFKGKALKEVSTADRATYIQGFGLDGIGAEGLKIIANDLSLVNWPEKMPLESRKNLINLLIGYVEKLGAGTYQDINAIAPLGVKAIDDHTLQITLRGPVPFLPEITKHYTWYPVPRHTILKYGKIYSAFTDWTDPGNMTSNGPFKLKSWNPTHHIEVERNPHYWDYKTVSLNGIRYLPISNTYTESRMFLDDQIHMTYTLPPEMIPYAREHLPENLRQEAYVGVRFMRVNTKTKPLDDPRVRHALAAAINQASLIDNVLQGGQLPAHGITPPFGDYVTPNAVNFDPEKAKKLLADAGFPDGKGFPEFKFLTTDRDAGRRNAEAFQAMWKKHLNINIRIEQREWTTYLQRQYDKDYDICAGGWIGDYLDPTTFLEMWIKDGGNNNTAWSSTEYEAKLREAENTADAKRRLEILAEAESILVKDLPVIPVYWYTTNYLLRTEVEGWDPLLLNNHPFKFVRLKQN